jgi:tetratricopeptide (TPR) repeat protein
LVKQGIQIAEASENYLMLIEFYRLRKNSALFISDNKEYRFCEKKIEWFRNCQIVQEKLLDYYNELIKEYGHGNRLAPAKKIKYIEMVLRDLKKNKKYFVSVSSIYLFSLIQLDYFLQKEDYSAARNLLQGLSGKLGASPLNIEMRFLARVQIELSNCELLTGNYQKAVKHAENTMTILGVDKKPNYYYTLEQLFLSVFFSGDFERADRLITELESIRFLTLNDFRISKFLFFRACVYFKKREYKQALQIGNKPIALNKDKTGFDIAIRRLRIQCLVQLSRFDEAMAQIENLRKHISRNYKKTYTSERDKLITRTLVLMQKRGFSNKPGKAETDLVAKLSSSSGKYKWSPKTPELIRFHEWYKEIGTAK